MTRCLIAVLLMAPALAAQEADPNAPLLKWMDRIAQQQLDARDAAYRQVTTPAQARERQEQLRVKLLQAIGGLPDYRGPLNARVTGTLPRSGYRIEQVVFESLPKMHITANLYLPSATGPHPAVLMPMGHWEEGKVAGQKIAANLARKGFVVLAYDPLGQGERQHAYDARLGRSLVGGSTDQHFMAGAQAVLAGRTFARYRVWDAKRALDYLVSRPEVDAARVGCTGCSGGGTVTTYISALDPRIKVAAPACYMNTFRKLFTGPTGDSEQTLPGFLSSGLDLGDYVAAFAPKPWLIASTVDDFFPLEGARQVYAEAQRWYRLLDAEDRVKWAVGPGGHGTPLEVREAIYGWMIRWLKDGKGTVEEEEVPVETALALRVLPSGQVAVDLNDRDVSAVIAETPRQPLDSRQLVTFLKQWIPAPQTPVPAIREGEFRFETEPGLEIGGTLLLPARRDQRLAAVLVVETENRVSPLARALAEAGTAVLSLTPRGLPARSTREFAGDWITNSRAWLIGRNLPGMRAYDIRRGVDALVAMSQVDPARIGLVARDTAGVWALLAAVTDERIARLWIDRTPATLDAAMRTPAHRNLHEASIPGLWLHGDLPDLVRAMAPRTVLWSDPTDWNRNVVPLGPRYRYRGFEESDAALIREFLAGW